MRVCWTQLLVCAIWIAGGSSLFAAEPEIDFNRDIRPILSVNCFHCHGPDERAREADLRLDTDEGIFGTNEDGVVIPHKVEESELFRRLVTSETDERMPPVEADLALKPAEIKLLKRWIESGAKWTGHWAYVSPEKQAVPKVKNVDSELTAIDKFLLQKLETENRTFSKEADAITLARRLSFDLTGLPPSKQQVDLLVKNNASNQAFEQLVDELMASPHFGEKLAMYWLDLVRYGDSIGYHSDTPQHISPYRDYVINAFNSNMPFDQFTREQLAGDLLEAPTRDQIIATGYNRLSKMTEEGGAQPKEYLTKYAADRVRTTSGVWLGITMGCAECHDHKYDPISTKDFYSMAAFFGDIQEVGRYRGKGHPPYLNLDLDENLLKEKMVLDDLLSGLANPPQEGDGLTKEERQQKTEAAKEKQARIADQLKEVDKNGRKTLITVAVPPREMRVLPRGNWLDQTGEVVKPALPSSLVSESSLLVKKEGRLNRLDLANWLVSKENPLTARVFVNRLWKLYFGYGLSRRLDDVGAQGEWPTHPELLDYLAIDFQEHDWDIKRSIKNIVMSKAYRQTSVASAEDLKRDPENRLFGRQSRWRLDAEVIRDNALATSGLLVREIGGQSVKPYQPAGYWQHLNFPKRKWIHDKNENQYRRGVYVFWQRTFLHPSLLAFDAPSREECTAERAISNTPKAALTLLNDPTFVEAARQFAVQSLQQTSDVAPTSRIESLWLTALSRPPSSFERDVLLNLYEQQHNYYQNNPDAAKQLLTVGMKPLPTELNPVEVATWTGITRAIMNLHEFITRN